MKTGQVCVFCKTERTLGEPGWRVARSEYAGFPHVHPERVKLTYHCPRPECRPSVLSTVEPLLDQPQGAR